MFNMCGHPRVVRVGLKILYRKSPTTRRGRHQARPRSVAESGREGDPGTIGLHRNRDDACALHSHAPYPAGNLPRTLEGKMNDFGRLLEKEIPRLRRYARALTHDVSRADDLVQDTLVRAIAKQHRWECGTNLRAWLFTLMHNLNVNGVRRNAREGTTGQVDDNWPSPIAATDPTGGLSLRDLDRALARISQEQRQVILLGGLEGTSYGQTAMILGMPIGTRTP